MDLYAEEILDHYKHPRHFGHLDDPTMTYHDTNPFCGDEITLELRIEDDHVVDVAFTGQGCAISRAAASMMSEEIIGMPLDELRRWDKENITDLLGIEVGPVRIKCALLPLKALKAAVWGLGEGDKVTR
ncbi:MAG: SUF system NifU family Fe-S cluster assembly protein [Anaerolineae bacterium CG2_30_64_16]|nr:MAG: SUF system NifU family Fe-S cluster assembly protein [Anaerolineae bacterium CG2_30_64_16]